MNNEEAIKFGKEQLEIFGEDSQMSEFIRLAIEALEERPKGKWIVEGKAKVYCTHCNEAMTLSRWTPKFVCCPYCGADMLFTVFSRGDL